MDGTRFDALTVVLASRRTALAGLLGGMTALFGLATPEEAGAHNYLAGCGKLPDPAKRRACRRRARAHNRKHNCKPKPATVVCGGFCGGSAANGCGKRVACPACPPGRTCLGNRSCAQSCPGFGQPGCPANCLCAVPEVGSGVNYCTPMHGCANLPPGQCASSAQCPPNHYCAPIICGGPSDPEENRCRPLCPS